MSSEETQNSTQTDWREMARRSLHERTPTPASLALSPDGALVAVGTMDSRVMLWNIAEERVMQAWEMRSSESELSTRVAEEMIEKPEFDDFQSFFFIPAVARERQTVKSLAFSPHGVFLCAGMGSGHVDFYTRRGRLITTWSTENKAVKQIVFSRDGRLLAYLTVDEVTVRRVITGQVIQTVAVGEDYRWSRPFAFSPDGRFWAINIDEGVQVYRTSSEKVAAFAWDDCLEHLDYGSETWESERRKFGDRLYSRQITALSWGRSEAVLAVGNDKGVLQQWVIEDNARLLSMGCTESEGKVMAITPTATGFLAAVVFENNHIGLWNSADNQTRYLPQIVAVSSEPIYATAFSDDATLLAVAFSNGKIPVWHTMGRPLAYLNVR